MAIAAAAAGKNAPAILNAANEIAVQAFLDQRISFMQIAAVVEQTLNGQILTEPQSLAAVQESDEQARLYSSAYIKRLEK